MHHHLVPGALSETGLRYGAPRPYCTRGLFSFSFPSSCTTDSSATYLLHVPLFSLLQQQTRLLLIYFHGIIITSMRRTVQYLVVA